MWCLPRVYVGPAQDNEQGSSSRTYIYSKYHHYTRVPIIFHKENNSLPICKPVHLTKAFHWEIPNKHLHLQEPDISNILSTRITLNWSNDKFSLMTSWYLNSWIPVINQTKALKTNQNPSNIKIRTCDQWWAKNNGIGATLWAIGWHRRCWWSPT